jgi:hypothetical protein
MVMVNWLEIGANNAIDQGLIAEDVRRLDYLQIHHLCGKNPDMVENVFAWETIREEIAFMMEHRDVLLETENGTII